MTEEQRLHDCLYPPNPITSEERWAAARRIGEEMTRGGFFELGQSTTEARTA
jgi:hypothetical protein